jgi:translocation and assembly module TamB
MLSILTGTLRIILGLLTALLIVAVVVVGWLLLTTSGLRAVLDVVESVTDGEVRVAQADGRVLGGFTLDDIEVTSGGTRVEIDRLLLDWSPGWLPAATLKIAELSVDGVRVDLPPAIEDEDEEAPTAPPEIPDISLPARLVLDLLTVRELAVTQAGETLVELDLATLSMRWAGRGIRIDELHVVHPEFGAYTLNAHLRTPPQMLEIVELTLSGPGELAIYGFVPLDFGEAPPDAELDLSWTDLHWPMEGERLFESARGSLNLRGPILTPKLSGELVLGPEYEVLGHADLDAHWRGEAFDLRLAWRDLIDPMNPAEPAWRSARGELVAGGRIEAWQARLAADAEAEGQQVSLSLRAAGDLEQAQIEQLRLSALGGRIDGDGRIRWQPELRGNFNARLRDLDPGRLAEAFPGRINGRLVARFALPESGPDARVNLTLEDSELREYPLSADIEASYAREVLNIARARVRSGDSQLRLSGRVTPPLAVQGEIDSPDLAALVPDVAGQLKLAFTAAGDLDALRLHAEGEAADVMAAGVSIGHATLDTDITMVGQSRLRLDITDLLAGIPIQSLQLALDGSVEDHLLSLDAVAQDGEINLAVIGGADLEAQSWAGEIRQIDFIPSDIGAWTLESAAALALSATRVDLAPLCLAGEGGRACLDVELNDGDGYAAFSVDSLVLGYFQPFLPPGMAIDGRIDGSGDAELRDGALARAEVALEITPGTLSAPGAPPLAFGPGRVFADTDANGAVQAGVDLEVAGGIVTARADLAPADADGVMALSGDIALDLPDLDFLPVFSPEVIEASGGIEGRFLLSGSTAEPLIEGRIALVDGRVQLDSPGLTLTDLNAEVRADARRQLRIEAGARSGEGEIRVNGEVDLAASPITADIRITGEDFQAANLPEVRLWIAPDLRIRLAEQLRVTGSVTVPRADIEPQKFSGGNGGVTASRDQIIVTGDDEAVDEVIEGLPIFAEVTVILGDEVRLEGYGLTTRLAGRLTVREEPGRLTRGRGELRLVGGQYQAYGQDLTIERGRLIFDGGPVIEPGLDFRAVRRPRPDILVGVQVRGTLEEPAFQLFSEPPMQQDSQLSWLVLGRPLPSGESPGDEQAMLAAAALSLGLQGGDWLAGRIGGGVGFDEISVGADPGEDPDQARLTVGKYIGTRLYVSYGVSLFQPGHIYRIRYDLGRGFAVQAETGVHSGGDLLYTIERGAPKVLLSDTEYGDPIDTDIPVDAGEETVSDPEEVAPE